jgi:hypothetical protein
MANEGTKPAKAAIVTALRITLKAGATREAKSILEQVQHHHQKDGGWRYWTYYTQFGPGETYVIIAPGTNLKTFDGAPAGGRLAAAEGVSHSTADTILTEFESTFHFHERVLLEYLPDFSNHPDKDGDAPGPLLFHTRLTLKPGSTKHMKDGLQQLVHHHVSAGGSGKRFWTYGTLAGGDERAYHIVMPFDNFAALSTTSDNAKVASIQEGTLTELDSHIATIERTVLEYLPSFSHPPAK